MSERHLDEAALLALAIQQAGPGTDRHLRACDRCATALRDLEATLDATAARAPARLAAVRTRVLAGVRAVPERVGPG